MKRQAKERERAGRKEVLIYPTVCYVYTELMGLSHIFKRDIHIPCTHMRIWSLVCMQVRQRACVCVCESALRVKVCAHACVFGWVGRFTFLRSVVYQMNLLRALAG